jgi:hypothetical protein
MSLLQETYVFVAGTMWLCCRNHMSLFKKPWGSVGEEEPWASVAGSTGFCYEPCGSVSETKGFDAGSLA